MPQRPASHSVGRPPRPACAALVLVALLAPFPAAATPPPPPPHCDASWQRPPTELADTLAGASARSWSSFYAADIYCPFSAIGRAPASDAVPALLRLAVNSGGALEIRSEAIRRLARFRTAITSNLAPVLDAFDVIEREEPRLLDAVMTLWPQLDVADTRLPERLLDRVRDAPSPAVVRAVGVLVATHAHQLLPPLIEVTGDPALRDAAIEGLLDAVSRERAILVPSEDDPPPVWPAPVLLALLERATAAPGERPVDELAGLLARHETDLSQPVVARLIAVLDRAAETQGAQALAAFGPRAIAARPLLMRKLAEPWHGDDRARLLEALAAIDRASPATQSWLMHEVIEHDDATAKRLLAEQQALPREFELPIRQALMRKPADVALWSALFRLPRPLSRQTLAFALREVRRCQRFDAWDLLQHSSPTLPPAIAAPFRRASATFLRDAMRRRPSCNE